MTDWTTLDPKDEATLPSTPGLYWWRLDKTIMIGEKAIARPAWIESASSHYNGVENRRYVLPDFSHWTGWAHTVPAGTQWKCIAEGEVAGQFHFDGVGVKPCPFCGTTPHMKWSERPAGGGTYIEQKIWRANEFQVQCFGCYMALTVSPTLDGVLTKWNSRSSPDDREPVHPQTDKRKAYWR